MKNLFLKAILFVLMLTMVVSVGITASAMEYPDQGYWANEAIDAAIANGLLQGKENGNIDSEANLTRAEMATIMVRAFGATVKADISEYVDLKPSAWYYDSFAKAVHMRVFQGDGTGRMRPDDNITREEVFAVVARALVLSSSDHSVLNKFNDASSISGWARDYMSILAQKSYVNGDNLGNANPQKNITRAEFAQLMHNIFRTFYTKSGEVADKTNIKSTMINVGNVTFKNMKIEGDLVIGDGNGQGTIRLENVEIKGRLLVRGSAMVELVKTTVGEMVVVNNYNTVVHFDNFREEKVFDGIILNTNATFKPAINPPSHGHGGGGGGGPVVPPVTGPSYTVEYYAENLDGTYSANPFYTKPATSATAGETVSADTNYAIEGFAYDPYNTNNVITAIVPQTGTVTLKVYYKRNIYNYTVEYYTQNATLGYDKITKTESAKFGATVTADINVPSEYVHNTSKGKLSDTVPANNNLVLSVYYDRETYTFTFDSGKTNVPNPSNVTITYGVETTLPTLALDDWTFKGWSDGTNFYEVNKKYTFDLNKDQTYNLTAVWEYTPGKIAYQIKYYIEKADGSGYVEDIYNGTSYPGDVITVKDPEKGFEISPSSPTSITLVKGGNNEISVYYNRKMYNYVVKHFTQTTALGDNYDLYRSIDGRAKYGVSVTASPLNIDGFERNMGKGVASGTVKYYDNEADMLVLEFYYDRSKYGYTVVYEKQNVDQNGYVEDSRVTVSPENGVAFGTELKVIPASDKYTGFSLNTSNQADWTVAEMPANNNKVIHVRYDRNSYKYVVKYSIEDEYGIYSQHKPDKVDSAVYEKQIDVTAEANANIPANHFVADDSTLTGKIGASDYSIELHIKYARQRYTVTIDPNGANEVVNPLTDVRYGTKIYNMLPALTKSGSWLKGWYDVTNNKAVDKDYELLGNVTLKPVWSDEPYYTVKYHLEGEVEGTYADADIKSFNYDSVVGQLVTADKNHSISGYEYAYNENEVLSGNVTAVEDGILTLHVYYKRSTFNYMVRKFVEKVDGSYEESVIGTYPARYDTLISVTAAPAETGFELYSPEVVTARVPANDRLKIDIRYNRKPYTYTVRHMHENIDLNGHDIVANTYTYTAKYGTTVNASTFGLYEGFLLNTVKTSELSGVVPADNSLVLNVYYDRDTFTYIVDYYREYSEIEKLETYEHILRDKNNEAEFGTTVTANTQPSTGISTFNLRNSTSVIPTVGFEVNTTLSRLSGEVPARDDTLILTVYYERSTYDYVINYWKQNTTLDGYTILGETVNGKGKYGTTIVADTAKTFEGFDLVADKNTEWSGVVNENGSLVLNVYYNRQEYSVEFDANGGTAITAPDKAYYGVDFKLPGIDASTHLTDDTQELKGWLVDGVTYPLNGTVNVTSTTTIKAVWGDKAVEIKYGYYVVEYYKQNTEGGYDYVEADAPVNVEVGSYTINPDKNRYDNYVLNTSYNYVVNVFENQTSTLKVYYDIKPAEIQYVTVTFIDNGDEVGTITLESGNSMADEDKDLPDASWSQEGYVKDTRISPIYKDDLEYAHTVNWGWYYNPTTSKWEPFTLETEVDFDIEVSLLVKKFAANVFVTPMADLFPEGFPFDTYYETETRFADTIKDILYFGAPLEALKQAGYWETLREKLVNFELVNSIDEDNNIQMQHIPVKFVDVIGEDKLEKYIVDSAKEMFGADNNSALKEAFVTYLETSYNSGNPEKVKEIKGLMVNTIDHILDTDAKTIEDLCREILKDKNAFKEITGYDYDKLPTDVREFAVEYIAKELSSNDELFNQVVKEYTGKEFAELPEDPKDLVVELTGSMLDDVDFLEGVIKDITGIEVAITDNMTVKKLFVKVAESKLENDDTFLEGAVEEVLGAGITVSLKDENGNYKTIQNYLAEIAVSKLSADDVLFADTVKDYVETNVSVENKTIREFFVDVVKEDLAKSDSKLLTSFVEEFTGYNVSIDDATTTKEFLVDAIMKKLENDSTLFDEAVQDIIETTVSVDGKTMKEFFTDVVIDKLSTDSELLEKVVFEAIGYNIDVDDSLSTRDFFVKAAMEKLENDSNFLDTATEKVIGVRYSDLTDAEKANARILIAKVVENELNDKGEVFDDVVNTVFEGDGIPADTREVIISFVAYKLMTDDVYYKDIFGIAPDDATRETEVTDFIGNLVIFGTDESIKDDTGFDISEYSANPEDAFIQLVKEEIVVNDEVFEEVTGYTISDITDEYGVVKTSKEFIFELAEDKLSDANDTYLADVVADLGYDLDALPHNAKDAITQIAYEKLDADLAFRNEIAGRFELGSTIDWNADAKSIILDMAEDKLLDDHTGYLEELVLSELGYDLSSLPANAKDTILYVAEDKLSNADTSRLNDTITKLGYTFTIDNWSGTAKGEILKVVENTFMTDSSKLEEAMGQVSIDITITDWNADAKTTVITLAKDMLDDTDNVYLDKIVAKLDIPASITDDWNADAKAEIKDYATSKLDTDDEFFHSVTGYYPSQLQDKTGKDVLIGIVEKQLATNDNLFKTATGWDVNELPDNAADFMVETVLRELGDPNSSMRKEVEEKAVDYLLSHHNDLEKAADLALGYLGDHPEERDAIVDTIMEEIYREDLDKLVYQLCNEDQFEIDADTEFIAEGLKIKLQSDYNYESLLGSKIPEQVYEVYPEQKIKDIYGQAYDNLMNQIDEAILIARSGGTGYIDSGVTIIFNPIDDFYTPLYERFFEIIEEKGSDKKFYFYYEDNIYLQEVIKLFSTESLFEGSIDDETDLVTGYKLRSLDYYYDLFARKMSILVDDAILWYYNSDLVDDVENVIDSYQHLILKYANATAEAVDRYATDGTLPNDKLSKVEKAFVDRYPNIVNELVAWYKDSDINKEYNDDDFQKVQDKVRDLFEKINLTTDEYFDKILGFEKLHEYEQIGKFFQKVSDDEYKFEAKGNIVTFLREVVEA